MSINPIDFLNAAKSYPEVYEVDIRSSLSRSYYAAYHACNSKFIASNNEDGGMHEKLIRTLIDSPEKKDKSIGYLLRHLKGMRVKADYKLDIDISLSEKSEAIIQAEKILEKLQ